MAHTRNSSKNRQTTLLLFTSVLLFLSACARLKHAQTPPPAHFRVLTYNVNRGSNPADIAAVLRVADADIICLQEADGMGNEIKSQLAAQYPTIIFKDSETRVGGEYAFLSKFPGREIAWIPSATDWFAGWIMQFETPAGSVQVLNVHLRPPLKGGRVGGLTSAAINGYLFTRGDRLHEVQQFYPHRDPNIPLIVAGDFNDSENSRAVRFLKRKNFRNALPEFDRSTPTWQWQTRAMTFRRRMDHIIYSPGLKCHSAHVVRTGPSDHFPVEAVFSVPVL